jgi:aminoglycoside phosphotransferase (APT) family kinase protein
MRLSIVDRSYPWVRYAGSVDLPLATLERVMGSPVVQSDVAPTPGGPKNRTEIVLLEDGRRLALQEYSDRRIAHLRLKAAEQLAAPLRAHGVPVPRVLFSDLERTPPWAVFEALPGEPGYVAADWDLSRSNFLPIARDMGRLLRGFHELDPDAFDLPRLWTDVGALSETAGRWLAAIEPHLTGHDARAVRDIIEEMPALLSDRPAVVCHGDFGPQNVLVVDERISGLLDFEDARIGDPLLDVSWWAWLVRAHTPEAFTRTWAPFLEAAGIDDTEAGFEDRVVTLAILLIMETAERFRHSAPERHAGWGARISRTLGWRGQPLT